MSKVECLKVKRRRDNRLRDNRLLKNLRKLVQFVAKKSLCPLRNNFADFAVKGKYFQINLKSVSRFFLSLLARPLFQHPILHLKKSLLFRECHTE